MGMMKISQRARERKRERKRERERKRDEGREKDKMLHHQTDTYKLEIYFAYVWISIGISLQYSITVPELASKFQTNFDNICHFRKPIAQELNYSSLSLMHHFQSIGGIGDFLNETRVARCTSSLPSALVTIQLHYSYYLTIRIP
jgi:hypothetical protein